MDPVVDLFRPFMAAVDAAGGAVVDDADAETYRGDDASGHGHDAEHGQSDEPEAAATQQVNEDLAWKRRRSL